MTNLPNLRFGNNTKNMSEQDRFIKNNINSFNRVSESHLLIKRVRYTSDRKIVIKIAGVLNKENFAFK